MSDNLDEVMEEKEPSEDYQMGRRHGYEAAAEYVMESAFDAFAAGADGVAAMLRLASKSLREKAGRLGKHE